MTFNLFFSFPSLWSSFLWCLKPPYNIVLVVNVLIITIIALSWCYPSISDLHDGPDENTFNCGYDDKIHNQIPLPRLEVKDVDLNFKATMDMYEEKDGEILGKINGGYERVVLKDWRNLSPSETPMVSARSGHRKLLKVTPKGKKKKVLRVEERKRHVIQDERTSTPLTMHYQRPDTLGLGPGCNVNPSSKKSTVALFVERKKRMRHEEQDLEFDAFIEKMKTQMRHEEQDLKFDEFIRKTKKQMRHEEQDPEFEVFLNKIKNLMRHVEQDLQFEAFITKIKEEWKRGR